VEDMSQLRFPKYGDIAPRNCCIPPPGILLDATHVPTPAAFPICRREQADYLQVGQVSLNVSSHQPTNQDGKIRQQ
jgi:hypothetical protein